MSKAFDVCFDKVYYVVFQLGHKYSGQFRNLIKIKLNRLFRVVNYLGFMKETFHGRLIPLLNKKIFDSSQILNAQAFKFATKPGYVN